MRRRRHSVDSNRGYLMERSSCPSRPGRLGAPSHEQLGTRFLESPALHDWPIENHRRGAGERRKLAGPRRGGGALTVTKLVHTPAWFSIESCMVYVLWAGFARQSDRRAGIAAAVVAGESPVFAAKGFRCPLTQIAELAGYLHTRNWCPARKAGVLERGRQELMGYNDSGSRVVGAHPRHLNPS